MPYTITKEHNFCKLPNIFKALKQDFIGLMFMYELF